VLGFFLLWMLDALARLLYSKKVHQGGNGLSKKYEANHCGGSIALLIEMFTCARTVSLNGPRIQLVSLMGRRQHAENRSLFSLNDL
jgi:hypothetical protein